MMNRLQTLLSTSTCAATAWCSLGQDVEEGAEGGAAASVRLNNISSRPVNVDITV